MPFGAVVYGRYTHPSAEVRQVVDGCGNDRLACTRFAEFVPDMFFHFPDGHTGLVEFAIAVAVDTIDGAPGVVFFGTQQFRAVHWHATALAMSIRFHLIDFLDGKAI
jgi:hypothetical protein